MCGIQMCAWPTTDTRPACSVSITAAWFDDVHVPRENLLNRYQIGEASTRHPSLTRPPLATMIGMRYFAVFALCFPQCSHHMHSAAVAGRVMVARGQRAGQDQSDIAVRYAVQRRQFDADGSGAASSDYGLPDAPEAVAAACGGCMRTVSLNTSRARCFALCVCVCICRLTTRVTGFVCKPNQTPDEQDGARAGIGPQCIFFKHTQSIYFLLFALVFSLRLWCWCV